MHDELIRELILKHFPNFTLGKDGKYHNVAMIDLKNFALQVVEESNRGNTTILDTTPSPADIRLEIAGKAMQGVLANPSSVKGQTAVAEFALSMADALIVTHLTTKDAFLESIGESDAPTP